MNEWTRSLFILIFCFVLFLFHLLNLLIFIPPVAMPSIKNFSVNIPSTHIHIYIYILFWYEHIGCGLPHFWIPKSIQFQQCVCTSTYVLRISGNKEEKEESLTAKSGRTRNPSRMSVNANNWTFYFRWNSTPHTEIIKYISKLRTTTVTRNRVACSNSILILSPIGFPSVDSFRFFFRFFVFLFCSCACGCSAMQRIIGSCTTFLQCHAIAPIDGLMDKCINQHTYHMQLHTNRIVYSFAHRIRAILSASVYHVTVQTLNGTQKYYIRDMGDFRLFSSDNNNSNYGKEIQKLWDILRVRPLHTEHTRACDMVQSKETGLTLRTKAMHFWWHFAAHVVRDMVVRLQHRSM